MISKKNAAISGIGILCTALLVVVIVLTILYIKCRGKNNTLKSNNSKLEGSNIELSRQLLLCTDVKNSLGTMAQFCGNTQCMDCYNDAIINHLRRSKGLSEFH